MIFRLWTRLELEVEEQRCHRIVFDVVEREIMRARAEESVAVCRQIVHTLPFGSVGGDFEERRLLAVDIGGLLRQRFVAIGRISIDFARVK